SAVLPASRAACACCNSSAGVWAKTLCADTLATQRYKRNTVSRFMEVLVIAKPQADGGPRTAHAGFAMALSLSERAHSTGSEPLPTRRSGFICGLDPREL